MKHTRKTTRRRNADATRAAILSSARSAFGRVGYDGAGVREIAEKAGVTAMMVNHYFGSKEKLFATVLADAMESPQIITPDVLRSADVPAGLAAALVGGTEGTSEPLNGFLIVIKSAANPRAAAIARAQIARYHQRQLSDGIRGGSAAQRSALLLSLVAGFQLMRQMIKLPALVESDRAELVDILTSVFGLLIRGRHKPSASASTKTDAPEAAPMSFTRK